MIKAIKQTGKVSNFIGPCCRLLEKLYDRAECHELAPVVKAYYTYITKAVFVKFIISNSEDLPEEFKDCTSFDLVHTCLNAMMDATLLD